MKNMSMKKEDYDEFQRQLALQNSLVETATTKTRKDDDGTEYEWDEEKKAWFPKLSTDLMIKYQSGYSDTKDTNATTAATYLDPTTKVKYLWDPKKLQWLPENKTFTYPDNYKYTDSATGYVYTWDAKANKWNVDETSQNSNSDVKSSEDSSNIKDNQNTTSNQQQGVYVDPETSCIYNWDATKHLWVSDDGKTLQPSSDWNHVQNYTDQQTGKTYSWDVANQSWKEVNVKGKKSKPSSLKRSATKPEWFEVEREKNCNVYVSGLPLDVTKTELIDLMTKCGIIAVNPVTNEPKLKLYLDELGNPKGDGLCCYLKKESVPLAIQILDGMVIRGSTITVQKAQFQLKGTYDASKKPKMLSKKEKKKLQKEQDRLLDWKLARAEETVSKTERVLILKNMFDVSEFEEDPVQITEIRDDLRKECEKFGPVKKVIVFDRHPDGVCSVAFKDVEAAKICQKALNGRWFACRTVQASIWDGVTDYQIEETDKEREVRLKKWEQFLTGDEKKDQSENKSESVDETTNETVHKTEQESSAESTVDSKD